MCPANSRCAWNCGTGRAGRSKRSMAGSGCAAANSASASAATPGRSARLKMPYRKCCCARMFPVAMGGRVNAYCIHLSPAGPRRSSRRPARRHHSLRRRHRRLRHPVHSHASARANLGSLLESTGAGCVWFDYNNDGLPDLYVANGQPLWRRHPSLSAAPAARHTAAQSPIPQRRQRQIHRCNGKGRASAPTFSAWQPSPPISITTALSICW